MLAINQMYLVL